MDDTPIDLLPGEEIRWTGRPLRHPVFRRADLVLVPFSVVWFGFAASWEATVVAAYLRSDDPPPVIFPVVGGLFVALGSYLAVGRFLTRAVVSRCTRYVVTDRRLIIARGRRARGTATHYLADLPPPVTVERTDGSGSCAFGRFPRVTDAFDPRQGMVAWSTEPSAAPVLWHVADVRQVRDLIAGAQQT